MIVLKQLRFQPVVQVLISDILSDIRFVEHMRQSTWPLSDECRNDQLSNCRCFPIFMIQKTGSVQKLFSYWSNRIIFERWEVFGQPFIKWRLHRTFFFSNFQRISVPPCSRFVSFYQQSKFSALSPYSLLMWNLTIWNKSSIDWFEICYHLERTLTGYGIGAAGLRHTHQSIVTI